MIRLHVLTAVTRPENLAQIEASMRGAAGQGVDLVWHQQADPDHQSVGGQSIKNALLDQIADGWVYILDDDNLLHPQLCRTLVQVVESIRDADLICVSQQHKNGWVRQAHPGMLRQTHVDAGQVLVRRQAIGDWRIPEHYCGDGEWIEELAKRCAGRIVCVSRVAAYYNWLRKD